MQSLILQIAQNWLEQETKETEEAKAAYMVDHCPAPDLSGDQAALMVSTVCPDAKNFTVIFKFYCF